MLGWHRILSRNGAECDEPMPAPFLQVIKYPGKGVAAHSDYAQIRWMRKLCRQVGAEASFRTPQAKVAIEQEFCLLANRRLRIRSRGQIFFRDCV